MPNKNATSIDYDFLIIGQGLAGSILAWSLLQLGKKVCVVSDEKNSASRVAAGLINPVTGQRFVLAEHTARMLRQATIFYQDLENSLGINFFHPQAMARIFNSEQEQLNCQKRLQQESYRPFFSSARLPGSLHSSLSGIMQTHTAWLDTNLLLDALAKYFQEYGRLIHADFDPADLRPHNQLIHWQDVSAKQIICCQGYKMLENGLFSWLPLQPAHGEIITCSTSQALEPYIINKSKWLLPVSSHSCRIGATYEPDIKQPTVQEKSKQQLITFAKSLFANEHGFDCTSHQAGIRPATRDKQPFIGFHPEMQNIGIFNGFGSRGSLMIPYYAKAFSDTLTMDETIPQEADIIRYRSLYA